ncbi:MAG TPA: ABC transporter substrate-binding protein [Balneolales bacterium]|nr:ABC transporter substrate-binding protein [Balneolales bacterium]
MKKIINASIPVLLLFIVVSCSQKTETIVVKQTPQAAVKNEKFTAQDTAGQQEQVLNYGELNNIESLDPLFAINNASQRIIMLIYEGLVSYGPNGSIQPALAKSWSVGSDSLVYTFHLRHNDFYQDNQCFTSGLGRRVTAFDVKRAFERMCNLDVPPEAARLFMSIHGFDAYYKEHHQIFYKKDRTLTEIPGIIAQNDTTIRIELDLKDPHFLQKLASPYAVVYPEEALNFNDQDLAQNPVGSGPFELQAMEDDSVFVLTRNKNYWKKDANGEQLPYLNQIRILNIQNETTLYKSFVTGDVQYIPEMGPQMMHSLFETGGQLNPTVQSKYTVYNPGNELIQMNYNPGNRYGITHNDALTILSQYPFNSFSNWFGKNSVNLIYQAPDNQENLGNLRINYGKGNKQDGAITFAYDTDKMSLAFTKAISDSLNKQFKVLLIKSPVVSRATSFYVQKLRNYYPQSTHPTSDNELLRFSYKRYALSYPEIKNIELNRFPWWQNLSRVTVPSTSASSY